MVLWQKLACKDAGRLCSGLLFRRKTDVPRLRVEVMDAMSPEGGQDFADEGPLVGLVELFAFGPPLGKRVVRVIGRTVEVGLAEIDHEWRHDELHLDDEVFVAIIEQPGNGETVNLGEIQIHEPAIHISLPFIRLKAHCRFDNGLTIGPPGNSIISKTDLLGQQNPVFHRVRFDPLFRLLKGFIHDCTRQRLLVGD